VSGTVLPFSSPHVTTRSGRNIALDFLKRPPKRLYPDYYQIIKHPIALEDIRKRLESNGYATLEAVKQDFELCFSNAKIYNMKESAIYRDAKDLLVS
jgi:chromatin structure-remodeling complex subunit RSC4